MNITIDHIEKNPFSRPGDKLVKVKAIILHYTACPGASAKNIRDYFNNLRKQTDVNARSASAHYAVDDDHVIEIIPLDEVAYHVGASKSSYTNIAKSFGNISPNNYTIGIEMCHRDESGKISVKTLANTVSLVQNLLNDFGLNYQNVFRHYDITGKNCPKYFAENLPRWFDLLGVIDGTR